jgi:hypothetical protein
MVGYDLPMYWRRAGETAGDPAFNVPFAAGLRESVTCGLVSVLDSDWRGVFATHLLNFTMFPAVLLLVTYHASETRIHRVRCESLSIFQRWPVLATAVFCYGFQVAGHVHIASHWLVAWTLGVPVHLFAGWPKLIPIYGLIWDKLQPHGAFMCAYDPEALRAAAPWKRVAIAFAGPYLQAVYLFVLGALLPSGVPALLGGGKNFALAVCAYTAGFLVWSAVWFYEDATGDSALLSAGAFEGAAAAYNDLETRRAGMAAVR